MRIIADLQIHSRYSRACSQDLNPGNIGLWADKKGIQVVGTGDFTHPKWLAELKESLEDPPAGGKPGLYQLKNVEDAPPHKAYFLLSAEVSSIYKQGDKVRRIHNMILAPNFAAVDRIIAGLEKRGVNLKADGRPIMGIHCDELVKIVLEADSKCVIIPAHAWTPHFGLFGSLSGFDTIEEAFGDQAKHIFAIETGLSSDPKMNWQISKLDNYSLVSNSDAHSLRKIGREANVFDLDYDQLSYDLILESIRLKDPKTFLYTIEFFPEEGKYHLDGHADCKFSCLPTQTKKLKGICPVCGKKLLVGVLNRVSELGDRPYGFTPPLAVPYKSVIPLEEIIADSYGTGVGKKVLATYEKMVNSERSEQFTPSYIRGGGGSYTEFEILLDLPQSEIAKISDDQIAEAIIKVRQGQVKIDPGYDGIFGKIHIDSGASKKKTEQTSLF